MTGSKSREEQGSGRNKGKGKGPQDKCKNEASYSGQKLKRGKRVSKKSEINNCFNCGKLGYFACDCTELKVMFDHNHPSNI